MRPRLVAAGVIAGLPALVLANSGIPGPVMWSAGSHTMNVGQWLLVTMAMCVLVEAAIYRYTGKFRRPLLASLVMNVVSLVAGIPLGLLGMIDPTMFVLPTIVSILVEIATLRATRRWFVPADAPLPGGPVMWANVVTNLIMAGYLVWLYRQAVG